MTNNQKIESPAQNIRAGLSGRQMKKVLAELEAEGKLAILVAAVPTEKVTQ